MRPPNPNRPPDNLCFKLLIPAGFLFCATSLSWVMTAFDRSGAPVVRWIKQYAVWAISVEAAVIVVLAVLAMALDRRQSKKNERPALAAGRVQESVSCAATPDGQQGV